MNFIKIKNYLFKNDTSPARVRAEPLFTVCDHLQVGVRGQLVLRVMLAVDRNPEDQTAAFNQRLGREGQQVCENVAQVVVDLKNKLLTVNVGS
jgi:hypothetical protein